MKEQAKKEFSKSVVEQKSTVLTVQVLWACHAFNATPEEAAQQVVTDLFGHLARGGTVPVQIKDADGKVRTLDVSADVHSARSVVRS